ncbi:MAG: hypothetical protein IJT90_04375 [Bacteroidaceae bacterium]|nr:hypothetical protein [Bacteroidaceae bacterium]
MNFSELLHKVSFEEIMLHLDNFTPREEYSRKYELLRCSRVEDYVNSFDDPAWIVKEIQDNPIVFKDDNGCLVSNISNENGWDYVLAQKIVLEPGTEAPWARIAALCLEDTDTELREFTQ